ncbi:MAG: hypothetical protein AVDCRST_MAG08-3140 [uncultured Acetobacteraceae bacterium]|uniref:Uncharacterized protein n=1 Tax=uncultured Acetobacteraceae bacterium TaxID=169975 RepID=A0A6J4J5M5_9PROT|nr:MAG: hypothetical protein AVDCRST_MAG08-3140 [uncultured Acetobacteraceae bacterium]
MLLAARAAKRRAAATVGFGWDGGDPGRLRAGAIEQRRAVPSPTAPKDEMLASHSAALQDRGRGRQKSVFFSRAAIRR